MTKENLTNLIFDRIHNGVKYRYSFKTLDEVIKFLTTVYKFDTSWFSIPKKNKLVFHKPFDSSFHSKYRIQHPIHSKSLYYTVFSFCTTHPSIRGLPIEEVVKAISIVEEYVFYFYLTPEELNPYLEDLKTTLGYENKYVLNSVNSSILGVAFQTYMINHVSYGLQDLIKKYPIEKFTDSKVCYYRITRSSMLKHTFDTNLTKEIIGSFDNSKDYIFKELIE